MDTGSNQANSRTRLSRCRRFVAFLLLVLVVAFLVVNPLWECHDHMDNLRHLGPHGMLMIFLLFACAGITLFRSLCWFSLSALRTLRLAPQLYAGLRPNHRGIVPPVFFDDAALPLRI